MRSGWVGFFSSRQKHKIQREATPLSVTTHHLPSLSKQNGGAVVGLWARPARRGLPREVADENPHARRTRMSDMRRRLRQRQHDAAWAVGDAYAAMCSLRTNRRRAPRRGRRGPRPPRAELLWPPLPDRLLRRGSRRARDAVVPRRRRGCAHATGEKPLAATRVQPGRPGRAAGLRLREPESAADARAGPRGEPRHPAPAVPVGARRDQSDGEDPHAVRSRGRHPLRLCQSAKTRRKLRLDEDGRAAAVRPASAAVRRDGPALPKVRGDGDGPRPRLEEIPQAVGDDPSRRTAPERGSH